MSVLVIQDKNGKKYIKGRGKFFYLTKNKSGAVNKLPKGWKVIRVNGRLHLKRTN